MGFTADVDTGGTFTDGYFSDGERYWLAKVETTPHDFTVGFVECLEEGARQIGLASVRELVRRSELIRFSTTLTTNALVEGRGPTLGLITSPGLDEELLAADRAAVALVDRELVATIDQNLEPRQVIEQTRRLLDRGARGLVVALRNSARSPAAEREVLRMLDTEYPPHLLGRVPVTLSHQVSRRPEDRLRATAALLNARVHALLARSLRQIEDALRERSAHRPLLVVHSDGGCARVAKTRALDTYGSGPAAVAYGVASLVRPRAQTAIAMDLGGTTTDLTFLVGGAVPLARDGHVCGHAIGRPSPEIWSLGLGGGSIARLRAGELTLGPDSAGVLPGPACFGLGGSVATVTDACLVLGYFDPEHFLGGRRRLDLRRALDAIGRLESDARPEQTALAIKTRLERAIADAIRQRAPAGALTGASLMALGGGGGLHAAAIAHRLGLGEVRIFPFGPTFGAFGASTLDVVHVYQTAVDGRTASGDRLELGAWFQELLAAARRDVIDEGFAPEELEFELLVERGGLLVQQPVTPEQTAFELPPGATEPVMIWLRARIRLPQRADPRRLVRQPWGERRLGTRLVFWDDSPVPTEVYRLEALRGNTRVEGPCLVESELTTLAVPPGFGLSVESNGWMVLQT